jgi:phosphopantetheinyl transferase
VRAWTLKEAYAKCTGRGADVAFASVRTSTEPVSVDGPDAASVHAFQQLVHIGHGDHICAVALSRA